MALDDHPASSATTGSVAAGASVSGTLESGRDLDWFRVSLNAGQRYSFSLDGVTLSDPYLVLRSATGTWLAYDDDGGTGLNALLSYTPTTSGTYYLEARAFGTETGTYTLGVNTSGSADTTAPRVLAFSPADEASAVAVSADITLSFSETVQRGSGTLRLETASGTLVESFDAATSTRLSISGATVSLNPSANLDNATGYRLSLPGGAFTDLAGNAYAGTTSYNFTTVGAADDYAASAATTGRLPVGGASSGRIETSADRDWFETVLDAGNTYTFALNSSTANGLDDPYLSLVDADGRLIAFDDDSGAGLNARLSYTPSGTGTFFLEVRDHGSGTGDYTLTSTAAPVPGGGGGGGSGFSITVAYTGDPSFQPYFDAAALRWAEVIVGDLPDVSTASGVVDDLMINASIVAIDGRGGILGQAGATAVRSVGGLPYEGIMRFDSADVTSMIQAGTFESVVLHEMGHVLGLSSYFWVRSGAVSRSNPFVYVGEHAVAAYDALLPGVQTHVPLEAMGGAGTAGSHWSESVFDKELMTGYAEASPPMPLSVVTIGALRDLGYDVNYAAADPFVL